MKEVTLPSGAELKIALSPFKEAKALYQAILEETKDLRMDPDVEIDTNFMKDLFCAGFSSKKIESALQDCMKRALYNGSKLTDDAVFEKEEARGDYLAVCFEVALANVLPFMKSLSVLLSRAKVLVPNVQE